MSAGRRIVIAHVPYQQFGGEDAHVRTLEKAYLGLGHEVHVLPAKKRDPGLRQSLQSLVGGTSLLHEELEPLRPELVHLHNAFPLFGPALFRWALRTRTPMVMTVHNHRLYCTNGLAFRDGHDCDDCLGRLAPVPSLIHNCNDELHKTLYHFSAMMEFHAQRLYPRAVRQFIAPSPYVAEWLPRVGISASQIRMVQHAVEWSEQPGPRAGTRADVLYAGRLSQEKGVGVLLDAAKLLPDLRFVIAGTGPLKTRVEQATAEMPNVEYVGRVPAEEVRALLSGSRIAAFPSECREIAPLFVLESFVAGRRCVVARSQSTRWLFDPEFPTVPAKPGSAQSLADAIREALAMAQLSQQQVEQLRTRFGAERFSQELQAVVEQVLSA